MNQRFLFISGCVLFLMVLSYFTQAEGAEPIAWLFDKNSKDLGAEGWFAVILLIVTFGALILELLSPDIIMLMSASLFVVTGILTPKQFLEGFSNEIIMTLAMLCIVVRALEINGVLEVVGRRMLSRSRFYLVRMTSLILPVGVGSAFLNNTPIVLLMTPIVRKWALDTKMSPSKFLVPLSYATILGGTCTMIGTSTNIIVAGLIKENARIPNLTFFELSYIGIPLFIVGGLFILFFSYSLLPDRTDASTAALAEAQEYTAEFILQDDSPLCRKRIHELGKYFRAEVLIQVDRNDILIDSPGPEFTLVGGDRLVFAGDANQIGELHTVPGLVSAADPHFKMNVGSSHFSEIVIPTTSLLIGKSLKRANFRTNYGASVFAVYRQGRRVPGSVGNVTLQAGDTLMLISGEPLKEPRFFNKDFYFIRPIEKLQIFHPWRAAVVLAILVAMIVAATLGIPIMLAALTAAFAMIFTGNISFREAQNSIAWNLLLLIATSFAFAQGIKQTGVAYSLAEQILGLVGTNPYMLIGGLLLLCVIGTELMTNNAAALVFFPIAIQTGILAGYTNPEALKAIGVAVAIGCSCAFSLPTGYQTNMIVYSYGGYRFTDFLRTGIPLNIIVFILGTLLIPRIWPMQQSLFDK